MEPCDSKAEDIAGYFLGDMSVSILEKLNIMVEKKQ